MFIYGFLRETALNVYWQNDYLDNHKTWRIRVSFLAWMLFQLKKDIQ